MLRICIYIYISYIYICIYGIYILYIIYIYYIIYNIYICVCTHTYILWPSIALSTSMVILFWSLAPSHRILRAASWWRPVAYHKGLHSPWPSRRWRDRRGARCGRTGCCWGLWCWVGVWCESRARLPGMWNCIDSSMLGTQKVELKNQWKTWSCWTFEVDHLIDPSLQNPLPFYAGAGSSPRKKLRAPARVTGTSQN